MSYFCVHKYLCSNFLVFTLFLYVPWGLAVKVNGAKKHERVCENRISMAQLCLFVLS